MSLLASVDAFQKAFVNEDKSFTEEFLIEFRTYLITKDKKRHRLLLEALDRKEGLSSFRVRSDVAEDLCMELLIRDIPFVLVMNMMGEYGTIIRAADRTAVMSIITYLLKKKGTVLTVMTGEELIEKAGKETSKGLIAVNDLTLEEIRMLEELCRESGELSEVSEDRMNNGRYRFMVSGKRAAKTDNFARVLFTMNVLSSGSNKEINLRRIENTISYQDLRFSDFGRDKGMDGAVYVVGSDNQYVKMEQDSFEYGHAGLRDGYVRLIPSFSKDMNEENYRASESSFLNRITQPACTKDIGQVMEHFSGMLKGNEERDSLSFGYTVDEKNTFFGEKRLVSAITDTVMKNVRNEDIMHVKGKELHKIGYLTTEMGRVLNGLINSEIPRGYGRKDFAEIISKIAEFSGGSFNPVNYRDVAEKMKSLNLTNEKGTIEIGKDMDRFIESIRMERDSRDEQEIGR